MRKFLLIAVALISILGYTTTIKAIDPTDDFSDFTHAIHMVENSGKKTVSPYMDKGSIARGPFAIHKKCWIDALNYDPSIGGSFSDCDDYDYSLKVFKAYMNCYGKKYIAAKDWKMLSFLWNGGTSFGQNTEQSKKNVEKYWKLVQEYL